MTELAVARLGTIVRLGEAHPVVFFSSAVDFILPVNCARKEYHRKRPAEAHNSPRQRHAREHVSNVQRGGAMSHGTIDGSRNKPQNSLSQSRFSPICCGRWLKIVLKPTKLLSTMKVCPG